MLVLIVVGFAAGVITSISPCVLPVLPVVLTGTAVRHDTPGRASDSVVSPAERNRRRRRGRIRALGVVFGLVVSFCASTLFGSLVLSALHLPQDLLRDIGIVVLVLIGLSLLVPRLGDLLERPFSRLPVRRRPNPDGNGLVLGLGLGLLFVPCAGPVLATIAVVGATHRIGLDAVVLTIAFGVGVGVPLLVVALAGDAITRRTGFLRRHARPVRLVSGVIMILVAAAIGFNLTDGLQRAVPGYSEALQKNIEQNDGASDQLRRVARGGHGPSGSCGGNGTLGDCGTAPELRGITAWLNTPGDKPLTLKTLRGKVVLIDFWTYSCINCQRTLPHVEAWNRTYGKSGLVVIGVHTPEFAFEHVRANVRDQAAALGVHYPIAMDNDYATWDAYGTAFWPTEFLVDADGVIRHMQIGEGDYGGTEQAIRALLQDARPGVDLPRSTDLPNTTPVLPVTDETYLGYEHFSRLQGGPVTKDRPARYELPGTLDADRFGLAGTWTVGRQAITAGAGARLQLNYAARYVYLVLGGQGTVHAQPGSGAGPPTTVRVSGAPTLYTLVRAGTVGRRTLTLTVSPGVQAYSFTFG